MYSPDDHPNLPTSDPHRDPAVSYSESDLLPICPVCGYSLTGLPIQHRCPECGFEIDRRWLVFGGHYLSNRARTRGRVAVIAAIGMGILYVCTMAFLANRGIVFWPNFLTAICASAGPLLASLPITLVVRGDFLLITPEGVRQFQRSKCLRYTPWNEIQAARRTWVLPRIATDGPAGTRFICDMRPFGITLEGLDLCVKAINNYPRPPRTETTTSQPT